MPILSRTPPPPDRASCKSLCARRALFKGVLCCVVFFALSACSLDNTSTSMSGEETQQGGVMGGGEEAIAGAGVEAGAEGGVQAGITAGDEAGTQAGTEAGTQAGTEAGTQAGTEAGTMIAQCEISEAMMAYGCQSMGCHAPPTRSGLNLIGEGFEEQLINAPSGIQGCEGRVLIDPQDPSKSLILQAVGAELPPQGDLDACQVLMPSPDVEVSSEHQECFRAWVHEVAGRVEGPGPIDPFEPVPVSSAVRKVKTLLNGDAPTSEEISAVAEDQSALRSLIEGWIDSDRGQEKLMSFFLLALQQEMREEDLEQFDRLRRYRSLNAPYRKVMSESFARTALDLVARNQPLTQIATTREWMVTTANLVLLLYPDQSTAQRQQQHTVTPVQADAPNSLTGQVNQRTWYVPSLPGECVISQVQALEMMFGFLPRQRCQNSGGSNIRFSDHPLTEADFNDWRKVTFTRQARLSDADQVPFYDLPRLRDATEVVSRLPRLGFFTTSVFFNNWATNVDNQFRVTTNQALITMLHLTFSSSEPTEPLSDEGLDAEHSDEADCFGCHRQLDPMRVYFAKVFNVHYQRPTNVEGDELVLPANTNASFAFRNETSDGGNLGRFGQILAGHPRFASAWVQKLCLYANSTRCDESDPEFIRLTQHFIDANYDFKSLMVELFSSPLVTHLSEPTSLVGKDPIISITRRGHLCALLAERTGRNNICEVNRVRSVLGLIPQDGFARGVVDFTQPSLPSAFHYAAVENLCEAVARTVVVNNHESFPANNLEVMIPNVVSKLMGITLDDARYMPALTTLTSHHEAARNAGLNVRDASRSVFTLACLSPDVMGVGL